MTLFTSDERAADTSISVAEPIVVYTDALHGQADTSGLADGCMIAALVTAVFGMVYEIFSFGVFSFAMIYAFGFFAVGGVLFWRLIGIRKKTIPVLSACFWNAGLATLTVGSLLKGVLDIYGSSNSLLIIFPVLGVADMLVCVLFRRRRQ